MDWFGWLKLGAAAAFWVAIIGWLLWRITRDECRTCKGSGETDAGRLCPVCKGTGHKLPAGPTWRMEIGKGGRLWWTCSNGTRVCGLCYDTGVVVDHVAGYKSGPCPECSRPDGMVRPMGVSRDDRRDADRHPPRVL